MGAATPSRWWHPATPTRRFKPHQRGGGCCNFLSLRRLQRRNSLVSNPLSGEVGAATEGCLGLDGGFGQFQTPSAGRWVLQQASKKSPLFALISSFKPHQRGGGCCNPPWSLSSLFKELNTRFREPPPLGGGASGTCHLLLSAAVAHLTEMFVQSGKTDFPRTSTEVCGVSGHARGSRILER